MVIVGIDPGLAGAIAVFGFGEASIRDYSLEVMPILAASGARSQYDLQAMARFVQGVVGERHFFFVEKLQPMPSKFGGGIANYSRGRALALWEGLLHGMGAAYELVPPQTWQKEMLAGTSGRDTKQRSIIAAQRIFKADLLRTERSRKPDHGMADALLIAEWGRRKLCGTKTP